MHDERIDLVNRSVWPKMIERVEVMGFNNPDLSPAQPTQNFLVTQICRDQVEACCITWRGDGGIGG